MTQPSDIHSITEFRHDRRLPDAIARDGRPHILTHNGRPKLVVQELEAYLRIHEALDRADATACIRAGLASVRRGEGRPAPDVIEEIRRRHGISSSG